MGWTLAPTGGGGELVDGRTVGGVELFGGRIGLKSLALALAETVNSSTVALGCELIGAFTGRDSELVGGRIDL